LSAHWPRLGMMEQTELNIFRTLIRQGAAAQDVFDGQVEPIGPVSEAFVQREVSRVTQHQAALCPLLEQHVGQADAILDVGCGTGGTTVAMALSPVLKPQRLVGVDPNPKTIEAAGVRARGYQLSPPRLEFSVIDGNKPLPFDDGEFDLTTCVSVLEFVESEGDRRKLVAELKRVTRPGGHVYLATPNPHRLSRVHKSRWIGDSIFRNGVPWSWPPGRVAEAFANCQIVPLERFRMREIFRKRGWGTRLPDWMCRIMVSIMPWQKVLARMPG
jgi:SAM-dependent methyltransferase